MDSFDSEPFVPKKAFICTASGCNASFSRNSKLLVHIRKHTGERPFVCDEPGCDKTYTNNSHLRRHNKVSHGEKVRETLLTCEHDGCGVVFANKYSLKKHSRKHNPELYRFKCNNCLQGFHRKKLLQQHSYLHTGEAAFSCDSCEMSFTTSYGLNKHKRSHRTYKCDCGKLFHKWTLMLAHRKLCKQSCFKCDFCDKTFSRLVNFRSHQQVHQNKSEKLVFVCPYADCKRLYFFKKNLKHHVDNFHKKINQNQNFMCTYPKCNVVLKTKPSLKMHLQRHFQWQEKKRRRTRHDKGKPKKSMISVLVGEQTKDTFEMNKDESERHHIIENHFCVSSELTEQDDLLLKQCDSVLQVLNEKITAI